jgi:hypothetical protein
MRKFISLLLTVLFLLFSQAPVNAAVKAGSACKNIGETAESSGKVFTCNKSGKKLVWSKGVDIDLGWYAWNFRINSKGVLERKDSDFGKWNSLPTRSGQVIDPIRLKAFNEIQKYSTKTIPKGESLAIRYSPNVSSDVKRTINYYFSQSYNFFRNEIPQSAKLETIVSTEKDDDFLKSNILEVENNSQYGYDTYSRSRSFFDQFRISNPLNSSGGGAVGSTSQPGIFMYIGAVCSCFKGENVLMYNIAHEVTHYFQSANTPSVRKQNFQTINGELKEQTVYIPLNLMEGAANTLGSALIVKYPSWYSDQMDWHLGRLKSRGYISEIRSKDEAVSLLLEGDSWLPKKDTDPEISYILGQLQYEFYISKYGIQAFFDLFKNIEKLGSYDAAIVQTIGKSKSEFYSESADYVMKAFNRVKD